ncbi:MarR family winged helix-turn-helix transcriptional regulator [Ferdinandcohnia quinoae]|uniref:MarR family transcriptional regulator n=1 Tax=Fredinandcohnia quinoae TaxID=2918902 RepID=A0AAW5E6I0_9BACI|nr:MarR family transcriptional regulator [Fredinandcohnia sp. SECRCQ15]
MSDTNITELVDRYLAVSFSVEKKAEALVKEQIGNDLTSDQYYTLRYINNMESCTSTELAEVFDVKKSAITAIITRMWEKGLIQRTRDENDRRVVYLSLTVKGKELFVKTEERIYKLVESFITKFEQAEIEQFIETYERLNQILIKDYKLEE